MINKTNRIKWISLSILLLTVITLFAYNPPKAVLAAFKLNFPQAKSVEWTPTGEKKKAYRAAFTLGKDVMNAYYDLQGNLAETDKEIVPDSIPAPVKSYLDRTYEKYKIKESRSVSRDSTVCCYELVIKSDGLTSTIVVTKEGVFTNR